MNRVALVGNPNVGKSVIFGALTGTYATVSNYPGTTVEVARATMGDRSNRSHRTYDGGAPEVIDTPGVNSLTPNSEDERVTRDILLEGVDCVVQVADAKNLARALIITLQLAEAGLPFVLVLNMMDEAADRGISVDTGRLAASLGVPVLQTVAVRGQGVAAIGAALDRAARSSWQVPYPQAVEDAARRLDGVLLGAPVGSRWLALMCLAGDETLRPWLAQRLPATELSALDDAHRSLQQQVDAHVSYAISRARTRAAEQLARSVTSVSGGGTMPGAETAGPWAALGVTALACCLVLLAGDFGLWPDAVAMPLRIAAWLCVGAAGTAAYRQSGMRAALGRWAGERGTGVAVLFVVVYLVYRFVGVLAAGTGVAFLEQKVFGQYLTPAITAVVDRVAAAAGPPQSLAGRVAGLGRDLLVGPYGLVTMALTYSLAIILPIVSAFFIAFSILEDSGYLPRLAITSNRVFRGMGLNGKAVLPMVLGLGCDTMATLTARIMETRKERMLVTLLLALGVPCSAQLGVTLGLFGALPFWAPVVWGGVVLGVMFSVGYIAARLLPGESSDLILEVPPMRRPQIGNIVIKTVGRLEWYLKEAVPIFMLGTFVLWGLDSIGLLARIVHASEPAVVGILKLPAKAAEAFLIGFFRRDYGSAGVYALFRQGMMTPVQAVVSLVTITLFVPCVANFFVIVKEQGVRTALAMSAFIFPLAFFVGGTLNLVLRAIGLS